MTCLGHINSNFIIEVYIGGELYYVAKVSTPCASVSASSLFLVLGAIHDWGTTFGTKELRTMSHWISMFIIIYYYLINIF